MKATNSTNHMKFFKLRDVKSPSRGTSKSAGIDFYVPMDFKARNIAPFKDILIPSGIKVQVPAGYALAAFNKSGIALKKKLIKGAELVDEDYQGEIHIHVFNLSSSPIRISPGDKLIQFVLIPICYFTPKEVASEELLYEGLVTERGEGGFGHTDKK